MGKNELFTRQKVGQPVVATVAVSPRCPGSEPVSMSPSCSVIKERVSRLSRMIWWAQGHHSFVMSERRGRGARGGHMAMEAEAGVVRGRGYKPRDAAASGSWKRPGHGSPVQSP